MTETKSQRWRAAAVVCSNFNFLNKGISADFNTSGIGIGILLFKADQGYRGGIQSAVSMASEAELQCVKSNFGTSDFIPIEGRWVVERTFSWMENYRRLTRNYERYLKTAQAMFIAACLFLMIRYFR